MRTHILIAALLAFAVLPIVSSAQTEKLAPGIYAVKDGEFIPLTFSYAAISVDGKDRLGLEFNHRKCRFKEVSSGVEVGDTFIIVVDPQLKKSTKKFSEFNPFTKSMTPEYMIAVPLDVDPEAQVREYDPGLYLNGVGVTSKEKVEFDWAKIGPDTFQIKLQNLLPGEYGFIFKHVKGMGFDFSAIFGFTVPET